MAKFLSDLVHNDSFITTELTQFSVGHTHGPQDQRFSECCCCLKNTGLIESPDDAIKCLQHHHKPRQGRALVIEKINAAFDFKAYYEPLQVDMHGHTQTHSLNQQSKEACHVWRFVKRRNCHWDGPISTCWPDIAADPNDIILLVKRRICDGSYSQEFLDS